MKRHGKMLLLLVMLAATTLMILGNFTPAAAQNEMKTDEALKTVIIDRLSKHGLLTRDTIQVTVSSDTITLAGTVSTLADKNRALSDVEDVGEGYTIIDNLIVRQSGAPDQEIADKIVKELQGSIFYGIFDWVNVDVNNGVATLTGWAYDTWHRTLFVHLAEKVVGVTEVRNEIKILPLTPWNDNIRRVAALLIYDNPDLNIFSRTISPPIHILVIDDMEVYLEGYVSSKFQKNWIAMIVNGRAHPNKLINNLKVE